MNGKRLISLDAFRGLAIAIMIMVNNPGSEEHVLPPLRHAEWHGWTLTDLVFPFFLFIVGVALVFSLTSRLDRGASKGSLMVQILRRAAILFALGLLLDLYPYFRFSNLRVPGVLQRIALCYAAAAFLFLKLRKRGLITSIVALLAGYWLVMILVPVPGYGAGNLTPEGNLAGWLDRILLKGTRLYRGTWDPEGVLSTFPAIATPLLGVLAGLWLSSAATWKRKSLVMTAWGCAGILAGYFWGLFFPINKNLWTSSFVIFTAGWALVLLGVMVYLCDEKHWKAWAKPMAIFGANPIAAYVLSSILTDTMRFIKVSAGVDGAFTRPVSLYEWVYSHLFASWAGPLASSELFALAYVLLWLGIMYLFYRKKIFIRI